MELLIMLDALKRASAARITAVVPYYAYGRTDKKDQPRVPITARLLADLITVAGADRLLTMDLHAGQIQGFFRIPVDELRAGPTLANYFLGRRFDDAVVVAPDLGAAKRGRALAERLGLPLSIIEKRRSDGGVRVEALRLIGEVAGKTAIIVDDEIDTAGSVVGATEVLVEAGAKEVYACCTHAILSGPAIDRIRNSRLKEVVVTDTVPLAPHKRIDKVRVLSVAPLFAETMRRIHDGLSVADLFR
jgi:ribose-phosphate pyrophosphokinase